jgi:hypothetical protein
LQNISSSSLLPKNVKIKIYKTITPPFALYGCETWSLILTEGRRLRVFENRVLRTFGPKRYEVTGEWRRLHKEELYGLNSSLYIIRVIRLRTHLGGACSTYAESRGAYRVLVEKAEESRPFGRQKRR